MGKNRKSHKPALVQPSTPFWRAILRDLKHGLLHNIEGVFLALAVTHIFFFLVLFATFADFAAPSKPPVFGTSPAAQQGTAGKEKPGGKGRPVSLPGTLSYLAYTLLAAGIIIGQRRHLAPKIYRFILLMLAPGSIFIVFLIVSLLRA